MFELAMTSFCHNEVPSIIFDQFNDLTDFQDTTSLLQIICVLKNIRFTTYPTPPHHLPPTDPDKESRMLIAM